MALKWFAAALLIAMPASAHDWYPIECCHGMDCAPVERVDFSTGEMIVTSKNGSVIVQASFTRRESKDNRMHVCMRPGQGGNMRLLCVFLPPAS